MRRLHNYFIALLIFLFTPLIVYNVLTNTTALRFARFRLHVKNLETHVTPDEPLLVIFTTFKNEPTSSHHSLAHRLAVINWASFGTSLIKPVLFTDLPMQKSGTNRSESELAGFALENGWDVLPVPSKNSMNLPHLKPMYREILRKYNSTFHGYVNGDILFDNSLVQTLTFLKECLHQNLSNNVLLVGRRFDVNRDPRKSPSTNSTDKLNTSFQHLSERFEKFKLSSLVSKEGVQREDYAIDYFFFSKHSTFHWPTFRNVVISRKGYDNYVIVFAQQCDVKTVDCSKTLLAVHVSKPGVHDTGKAASNPNVNMDEIGRVFPYMTGLTSRTTFYLTNEENSTTILLKKRY